MLEFLAGFDALGAGTLIGSLLFLGGLIWVLVDNRSFDELNRRTTVGDGAAEGREGRAVVEGGEGPGRSVPGAQPEPTGRGNEPRRPGSRRRAA